MIEYGGLFPFNVARMQKKVFLPPIETETSHDVGGEDLRAPHDRRRWETSASPSVKPGDTGFARADLRFSHEYVTPMAAIFFEHYVGKDAR